MMFIDYFLKTDKSAIRLPKRKQTGKEMSHMNAFYFNRLLNNIKRKATSPVFIYTSNSVPFQSFLPNKWTKYNQISKLVNS